MRRDFDVGDIVEATENISRHDGKTRLKKGGLAKVIYIWQSDRLQIVDIVVDEVSLPIRDIVCLVRNVPLKIVKKAGT